MKLMPVQIEIIKQMREVIEENTPTVFHHQGDYPVLPRETAIYHALDIVVSRYKDSAKHRIAAGRMEQALRDAGMWENRPHNYGYRYFYEDRSEYPLVRILPGDISEDTYYQWCVMMNLAWLDRILDMGEIK